MPQNPYEAPQPDLTVKAERIVPDVLLAAGVLAWIVAAVAIGGLLVVTQNDEWRHWLGNALQ